MAPRELLSGVEVMARVWMLRHWYNNAAIKNAALIITQTPIPRNHIIIMLLTTCFVIYCTIGDLATSRDVGVELGGVRA